MTEFKERIDNLEQDIRSLEENLCEVSVNIMDAKLAIEQAEENHRALLTKRNEMAGNLGALRTKLEYAKDGLL